MLFCIKGKVVWLIWLVCLRAGVFVSVDYIFVPVESRKACISPSVGRFYRTALFRSALPEGEARFLQLSFTSQDTVQYCWWIERYLSVTPGSKYVSHNHSHKCKIRWGYTLEMIDSFTIASEAKIRCNIWWLCTSTLKSKSYFLHTKTGYSPSRCYAIGVKVSHFFYKHIYS